MVKKLSSTRPSPRVRTSAAPPLTTTSNARAGSTTLAKSENGISFATVVFETTMGQNNAEKPTIIKVLKRLLPTMLPRLMSEAPRMLASRLTMNSGRDVPKATIVKPMTISGIWKRRATETAPSVSLSAPTSTKVAPMTTNRIWSNMEGKQMM